jgi:uridylate kinase
VYSSDPKTNADAIRYDEVTYEEVIQKQLKVMDMTAVALAKENNIPIIVFSQHENDSLEKIVQGKGVYTIIKN